MVEVRGIWYDVSNIRKMKLENERAYIYFYKDEEPLEFFANQNQFNCLVARVISMKSTNR